MLWASMLELIFKYFEIAVDNKLGVKLNCLWVFISPCLQLLR